MRRRILTWVGILVGVVVGGSLVAGLASGSGPTAGRTVLAQFADALANDYAITATPVDPTTSAPKVSAADAVKVAQSAVGFTSPATAGDPVLVTITDSNLGTDSNYDGTVEELSYQDVLAWLVTIEGVEVPQFAPMGSSEPPTYKATAFVFVDANTGALIEAVTE